MRRQKGTGSVSQRTEDGLWVVRVDLPREKGAPRKRKTFYGKTEEEARGKLAAFHAEHPPRESTPGTREVHMQNARALGTHLRREWRAKVAAMPEVAPYRVACHYCAEPVHTSRVEKDHYVPVSRGGSDALGNLVATCRPCNRDKANMTGDEYLAYIGRRSWEGVA